MRRAGWVVPVIAVVGVLGVAGWGGADEWPERSLQNSANSARQGCSDSTIRGSYGIQIQGTRPASLGGPTESVVGLVMRRYDGKGTFTQIANIKGSINGWVPDVEGFGTYEVSANCTAVALLEPAPGVVIQERMVIVDRGNVIYSAPMSPPPPMLSAVQQRVHTQE